MFVYTFTEFQMRISELISEGAGLSGFFKDEELKAWNFPQGYASDADVEGPYLSNSTAREVLSTLGMNPDFENSEPVKIEVFINLATQWLQKHIGKPSTTIATTINKKDSGATVYDMGKSQGRLNELILQLNQQARKIKQKYPTITHVAFV